jgi:hypothetical protein
MPTDANRSTELTTEQAYEPLKIFGTVARWCASSSAPSAISLSSVFSE